VKPILRRATLDDLPAMALVDSRAFGVHMTEQDIEDFRPLFVPEDYLLACDPSDGRIIGITCHYPFTMTVPGGARLDVAGVSWVSVATTHRRRGVLREMFTAQHRRFVEDGLAMSILTATQGGIYGRFGYGPATSVRSVEVDRRLAAFRTDVPDPGGVRQVEADEARKHAPEVHQRWCAVTPGALSRSEAWWDFLFLDRENHRQGGSAMFYLVHPDGFAAYRIDEQEQRCRVVELVAATDDAHIALWRVLLGLDLVHTVTAAACTLDDPLPFLLADPRQMRTRGLDDEVWTRALDIPVALAARRYATELDVTIEVHDSFLDRGGRFRLRGGPEAASCAATDRAPDVRTDVATLGSLYLGGHRAESFARAGLLETAERCVLRQVDVAFAAEREPQTGTHF
jgi:predicted acetyltransferase